MKEPQFYLYKKSNHSEEPDFIIRGWNKMMNFLDESSHDSFDMEFMSVNKRAYTFIEEDVESAPRRSITKNKTIKTRSKERVEYLREIYTM